MISPIPQGFRQKRDPVHSRKAFALIIAIALMAFLLLLLLGLSALVNIEVQSASVFRNQQQARENALLGLQIALGKIQLLTGPDQVITARADIAGTVKNPYLVGVWDSTATGNLDSSTPKAWLVSGGTLPGTDVPDPTPSNDSAWMLHDSVDAASQVKVIAEPLPDNTGSYAYWVSDESLKANVAITDPWESPTADALTAANVTSDVASQYRYLTTGRSGIEGVTAIGETAYPVSDQAFKTKLEQMESLSQLPMANTDSTQQAILKTALKNHQHDLTAYSQGLLVDVANGGLKKDLTAWLERPGSNASPADDDYIGPSGNYMPHWKSIRDYYDIVADGTPKTPVPASRTDVNSPVTDAGLHPVITYGQVGFNFSNDGDNMPINFHVFPLVVLWNPYNVPLASHDYELWVDFAEQIQYNRTYVSVGNSNGTIATAHVYEPQVTVGGAGPSTNRFRAMRFLLKCPQIPPGKSLAFTLPYPAPGTNLYYDYNDISKNIMETQLDEPAPWFNSIVLTGKNMTAADRSASPFSMYVKDGTVDYSLREPSTYDTLTGAIQTNNEHMVYSQIQCSGHNLGTTKSKLPLKSSGEINFPLLFVRTTRFFSETDLGPWGAEPRWLAYQNPLATDIAYYPGMNADNLFDIKDDQALALIPSFGDDSWASAGTDVRDSVPNNEFIALSFRQEDTPLFSLAQLQHANLALDNYSQLYTIGNSIAPPFIARDKASATIATDLGVDLRQAYLPFKSLDTIHDLSYELNEALWDTYYFSTVPTNISTTQIENPAFTLPNSRNTIQDDDKLTAGALQQRLIDMDEAAASLRVAGAFNINSTSVEAWKGLLHSRNGVVDSPTNTDRTHSYPHYSRYPINDTTHADSLQDSDSLYEGNRVLSDVQINHLADAIVQEVKQRGPFKSMSDFVNRRLNNDETGLKGTLQAAIDSVDSTSSIPANERVNNKPDLTAEKNQILVENNVKPGKAITAHWYGSDTPPGSPPGGVNDKPFASQASFTPGFLSQADLLTVLGPVMTARSDTFLIRAYGNTKNPLTDEVQGEAWCEAVVQRTADYIDAIDDPWDSPTANTDNAKFGRGYKLVSFRWLKDGDI